MYSIDRYLNVKQAYMPSFSSDGRWLATVRYGVKPPSEVGESSFSFDTGGGTQHITQSMSTVNRYASRLQRYPFPVRAPTPIRAIKEEDETTGPGLYPNPTSITKAGNGKRQGEGERIGPPRLTLSTTLTPLLRRRLNDRYSKRRMRVGLKKSQQQHLRSELR